MRHFRTHASLCALHLTASLATAATVTGRLIDHKGEPVGGASIVAEGTWATAVTDTEGRFTVDVPETGGEVQANVGGQFAVKERVPVPSEAEWILRLPKPKDDVVVLDSLVVLPSRYPVGEAAGAAMHATEALLTPGSLADINRALQTLPGVNAVDEGDALYVRGGDASETAAFINGSRYQHVKDEEAPLGTFAGTVSPFLAEHINFEAGGFGVRHGNLLSAVVEVETFGRPQTKRGIVNVGLGGLSGEWDLPQGPHDGMRLTGTWSDVKPILALNGSGKAFVREPHGHDVSLIEEWQSESVGSFKVFALEQATSLAVHVGDDPLETDVYAQSSKNRQLLTSWAHDLSWATARVDASVGNITKEESSGLWSWRNHTTTSQVRARLEKRLGEKVQVSGGIEGERLVAGLRESYGSWTGSDKLVSQREAVWLESDMMLTGRWRTVAGLRFDTSNLGGGTTWDPRLASGYHLMKNLDLSASWGLYHQRPEMVSLSWLRWGGPQDSQKATHSIAALSWSTKTWQARLEAYQKVYSHLSLVGEDRHVSRDGVGRSEGVELSGRFPFLFSWEGRFSIGISDTKRTDPRTQTVAPYSVPVSSAIVLQRQFAHGYQVGVTWREASGKPYTPVVGSRLNAESGTLDPEFGPPNSARLRPLRRLDFLLTRIHDLSPKVTSVTYLSISNVFDTVNEYDVTYSPDYKTQKPVRSILNRIVYVGVAFTFR